MASTGIDRVEGLDPAVAFKAPCRVATTENITLSGAQTIDGVAITNERVLVWSQINQSENGIWNASGTAWTRAEDFDGNRDVVLGTQIRVTSGTDYSGFTFSVTTANPIVIGASNITFSISESISPIMPPFVSAKPECKGDGVTDDYAAMLAKQSRGGRELAVPSGTYLINTSLSLVGNIRFEAGAKIKPASGVVITIAADCLIFAVEDWQDTSAGGSFTASAGCWEQRIPNKVSSPTGGFLYHFGFIGNSIDESSGTSFVFGGSYNFEHSLGANSELSVIGGGYDNTIGTTASATTIAGGAHHVVANSASHAAILGGAYQTVNASYGASIAGTLNTVDSSFSVVCGGQSNIAGDTAQDAIDTRSAFVGAGASNASLGLRSAIVGGFANQIDGTSEESFIGGGANNTITTAENAVICGGASNGASANNSIVLGGASNQSTGSASITGGESCAASVSYAYAVGEFTNAGGVYSRATGSRSKTTMRGQRSHASGYFAAQGDAQITDLVGRINTTGATVQNIDLFGGTVNNIVMPDDTTWYFEVHLVARRVDTNGENAAYKFEGCMVRDTGAASTALVGSVTKTVIAEDTAAWDADITADTTNGGMQIQVTGEAAKTIYWVARIALTEVAG
jgi:hypothetical protein